STRLPLRSDYSRNAALIGYAHRAPRGAWAGLINPHRTGTVGRSLPPTGDPKMPDDVRHPVVDKSRLPSRHVTVGPERAPHRAFLYSMGLSAEQIAQPIVGVATTWNEAAPCNIALSRQAQAAKKGVAAAAGTPREFNTITVTHGIAMGQ